MKNTNRQVKVAKPSKKHDTDRTNINNNAIDRDNRIGNNIIVPVWFKTTLTIEEAAAYSNIGITKLYEITNNPVCSFVLHVGNRKRLIKRKEFEKYLSQSIEI